MSVYTTELRWIVESFSQDQPGLTMDERITIATPKIFDFTFPYWNSTPQELEEKFIRHYFFREIGSETYGQWKFRLREKLNLIMPYYVDLVKTQVNYEILNDIDLMETFNENVTNTQTAKGTSAVNGTDTTTDSETINNSDFPQSAIENKDYLSTASQNSGSSKTTTSNNVTTSNDANGTENRQHTNNRKGRSGNHSPGDLIKQAREIILNVDNMIIEDLSDLFMLIY